MTAEQKTVEAEPLDSAEALSKALRTFIDEGVKLADSFGKAVVTAAQDLTNVLVIKVDRDTRERLDGLVDAGVASNRCKAAVTLIQEGMRTQQPILDRIEKTKSQISELRQELRSLLNTAS